jgi:hypothetical protein
MQIDAGRHVHKGARGGGGGGSGGGGGGAGMSASSVRSDVVCVVEHTPALATIATGALARACAVLSGNDDRETATPPNRTS